MPPQYPAGRSPLAFCFFFLLAVAGAHPLFAQAPAATAPAPNPSGENLEALKNLYQGELGKIQRTRDQSLSAITTAYTTTLDKMLQESTARADLEGALALKAERERIATGNEVTADQRKTMPPRVAAARLKYDQDRKPILDDARRRADILTKQYVTRLDLLQRQLTQASRLQEAQAVKTEREQVGGAVAKIGEGAAAAGVLKPEAARKLFNLAEENWLVNGDSFFGHVSKEDNNRRGFGKSDPVGPSTELRFELKMKAKWYQSIQVWIDGEHYQFSRGHWRNKETRVFSDGQEQHLPGKVESPDRWATLTANVQDGKLRFAYNGKTEFEAALRPPKGAGYIFNVGLTSWEADVQVKDVICDLHPPKR
jgi:hypothetical protein